MEKKVDGREWVNGELGRSGKGCWEGGLMEEDGLKRKWVDGKRVG